MLDLFLEILGDEILIADVWGWDILVGGALTATSLSIYTLIFIRFWFNIFLDEVSIILNYS